MAKLKITLFSDILCIWAYVSQIRIDELESQFSTQIEMDYRFFSVFGNTQQKIISGWQHKGGLKGYRQHVHQVAQQFEHIQLAQKVWREPIPHSSLPAHLYLCAVRELELSQQLAPGSLVRFLQALRHAFFVDQIDVSNRAELQQLLRSVKFSLATIQQTIDNGQAFAAMALDMEQARKLAIDSSPTLLFNENRQRLAGNVGYRIIEANVKELLAGPQSGQSWC